MPTKRKRVRVRKQYRTVALSAYTYGEVDAICRVLIERYGRASIDDTVEYMTRYFPRLIEEGKRLREEDRAGQNRDTASA